MIFKDGEREQVDDDDDDDDDDVHQKTGDYVLFNVVLQKSLTYTGRASRRFSMTTTSKPHSNFKTAVMSSQFFSKKNPMPHDGSMGNLLIYSRPS